MALSPKQRRGKDLLEAHDMAGADALGLSDDDLLAIKAAGFQEHGAGMQPQEDVSAGRSAALGMSQGASLGAADEIASQVVPTMATKNAVRMTPAAMEYWKRVNPADAAHAEWINKQYEVTPESVQSGQDKELGQAQEQHPLQYGAGYAAGAAPLAVAAGPSAPAQAALGGVAGAMGANGSAEDRIGGAVMGAGAGYIGGKLGARAAPQGETWNNVANQTARGLMDIPPEEAIRMETSGMMPKVVDEVRGSFGEGGRLGMAKRIARKTQPVGESIEDLLAAEAATGNTVDASSLADKVGSRATELERAGTFSDRSEAAPGMRYYEDVMRRQSTDQPATGAPKSALDVWGERKSLDAAADFGGRPGKPNNPDLARANIRPIIDEQLHGMVQPSKLAELNSLEDQYHTGSTAKKYVVDAATKVGSQGSALADTMSAVSGMGEARGRSMTSALSKPSRESFAINVGRVADWAAKKLSGSGQDTANAVGAGLGAAAGRAMGNDKLAQILKSVAESPDPDMEDYLYREMYPEYGAAMIAAEDEIKKAPKESADIQTMGNNMRKLQGM